MIKLPPGFDYSALLSDLWFCAMPFVSIAVLFVGYRYIRKSTGG